MRQLSRTDFYKKPADEVWSAAENMEHLMLSTRPLATGLKMPKLALRAMGKPNRPLRTYEELVQRYQQKLEEAGEINQSNFGPKVNLEDGLEERVGQWEKVGKEYFEAIEGWKEEDLDKYLMPHPLLGKLIVREMLFFTLYHTYHHLSIMNERVALGK